MRRRRVQLRASLLHFCVASASHAQTARALSQVRGDAVPTAAAAADDNNINAPAGVAPDASGRGGRRRERAPEVPPVEEQPSRRARVDRLTRSETARLTRAAGAGPTEAPASLPMEVGAAAAEVGAVAAGAQQQNHDEERKKRALVAAANVLARCDF